MLIFYVFEYIAKLVVAKLYCACVIGKFPTSFDVKTSDKSNFRFVFQ